MAGGKHGDGADQPNYVAYYAMEKAGFINKDLPALTPRLRQCDFTLSAGSTTLLSQLVPTLVTITDLSDPASVRAVEPTTAGFSEAFGPGYRLERITLGMVPTGIWPLNLVGLWGAPATKGIVSKIPFLTSHRAELRNVMRNIPPRFQTEFWQFVRD